MSSASPQSRKSVHQWSLSHWTRLHHRHPVFAMTFIQSSLESPNRLLLQHPDDEILSCSEDVSSIRDGFSVWVKVGLASILERPHGQFKVPISPFVKHRTEDTHHSILNIVLTTMYRAEEAQHFELESRTSTRVPSKATSPCKRQSSTSSTIT